MEILKFYRKYDVSRYPVIRQVDDGIRYKDIRLIEGKEAFVKSNYLRENVCFQECEKEDELYKSVNNDYPMSISDLNEKFYFELCKLLNVNCAKSELGYYPKSYCEFIKEEKNKFAFANHPCCISFNFLGKDEILIYGMNLIVDFKDAKKENCSYFLNTVINNIKKLDEQNFEQIKRDFLRMIIVDALVGNFERNSKSWGVIKNIKTGCCRFAPIFDNECLFYPAIRSEVYSDILIGSYKNIIICIKDNYYQETKDFVESIKDKITQKSIKKIFNSINDERAMNNLHKALNTITKMRNMILSLYKPKEIPLGDIDISGYVKIIKGLVKDEIP